MGPDLTPHPVLHDLGLPAIDQIAFLVRDMGKAAQVYGSLFGRFHVMDTELKNSWHRGQPASPKLRVGFVNHGSIEVELIQHLSGAGPYEERLERFGEGLFHLRYPVKDFDAAVRRLEAAGLRQTFFTDVGPVQVGYFEGADLPNGALIELIKGPADDLRHGSLMGVA